MALFYHGSVRFGTIIFSVNSYWCIMPDTLGENDMNDNGVCIVTGAFGYTGRHITRRLLDRGYRVRTLTSRRRSDEEFGGKVDVYPFNFDAPDELVQSMQGADMLFNTYWIRFERGGMTFEKAVKNSLALISAAEQAGVRRIVHISIANPSIDSPFPYYSGKARVEKAILESRLSYAIVRPCVIFGDKGILINNIAWFLRHTPVFGVPGSGKYGISPVFVEDVADLAVDLARKDENIVLDAVGPETFEFNDLLLTMKKTLQSRTLIMHLPPAAAIFAAGIIGKLLGDVILTKDEVGELMSGLLVSSSPPTCAMRLSDWMDANKDWLGKSYMSEIGSRRR